MESYNDVLIDELVKMAARKEIDAQAELAKRYAGGIGVEKDINRAKDWAEKAYMKGRTDLAFLLGNIYLEGGDGVFKDVPRAVKYFNAGANSNHIDCLCALSSFYHNGDAGLPKDDAKSFELLQKALTEGVGSDEDKAFVRYLLGDAYFEGIGAEPNIAEAVYWYINAYKNGYHPAYIALANCYMSLERYDEAMYYVLKACISEDAMVSALGKDYYNKLITLSEADIIADKSDVNEMIHGKDRAICELINQLHESTQNYPAFEKEANRLIGNAETLMRIGNYKSVSPAYERAAYEYPADFRGWFNIARMFTDNFAVYSVFEVENCGKAEEPEFCENMTYALRTVDSVFDDTLNKINVMYTEGNIDVSITQMQNEMYRFYNESASTDEIASYVRQYENEITYLYNKRPCVVTALTLHLLQNILNNDNIKKYNEKVVAHNSALEQKIERKVQDYITELAQNLRIDKPKDYASNAEALEKINSDEEYQNKIQEYRNQLKNGQEFYTEISNLLVYDIYNKSRFGKEKPYAGYIPSTPKEYNDAYVDFIVAFANRCGIQMRGYEQFYSPEKKQTLTDKNTIIQNVCILQDDYHAKFASLKVKYNAFESDSCELFSDMERALVKYEIAYSAYAKANSLNVFKQVFKNKELKETREDTTAVFEAAQAEVSNIANAILSAAQNDISELNEYMQNTFPKELPYIVLYDNTALDSLVNRRVESLKAEHERVQ